MMSVTEGKSILLEKTASNNTKRKTTVNTEAGTKIENRISCLLSCSLNRTLHVQRKRSERQTLHSKVFGCTIITRKCYGVAIHVSVMMHKCCCVYVCVCVCVCASDVLLCHLYNVCT